MIIDPHTIETITPLITIMSTRNNNFGTAAQDPVWYFSHITDDDGRLEMRTTRAKRTTLNSDHYRLRVTDPLAKIFQLLAGSRGITHQKNLLTRNLC